MQPLPTDEVADLPPALAGQALALKSADGRRRALLTASAWGLLQKGMRMAIGLVSVPLTLAYLGKERYGLWQIALSVNAFLSFLDIGLTPTLMNRMAEAHAKGDRARFTHYASGTLALGSVLLLVGLLGVFGVAQMNWPTLLRISDPTARAEATPLVAVILGMGVAGFAMGGVDSIFNARLNLTKPQVWATAANVLSFSFLLLGIKRHFSLPLLALLICSDVVLYRAVLLTELVLREPGLLRPRWREFPKLVRELVPVSVLFMGIQAAFMIFSALPNLLVAWAMSLSDVATFSVVTRMMAIPLLLLAGLLPVFWPAFTVAWARGERAWLRRHLAHVLLATTAALVAYDVVTAIFGDALISWWTVGHTRADRLVVCALGAWLLIQSLSSWLSTFLHSITDFRFELVCYVSNTLLLLGLGAWLVTWLGLLGMALAMALSMLITILLPMWFRVRQKLATKGDLQTPSGT